MPISICPQKKSTLLASFCGTWVWDVPTPHSGTSPIAVSPSEQRTSQVSHPPETTIERVTDGKATFRISFGTITISFTWPLWTSAIPPRTDPGHVSQHESQKPSGIHLVIFGVHQRPLVMPYKRFSFVQVSTVRQLNPFFV